METGARNGCFNHVLLSLGFGALILFKLSVQGDLVVGLVAVFGKGICIIYGEGFGGIRFAARCGRG